MRARAARRRRAAERRAARRPASGKGTIGAMLSVSYRVASVGVGALLRAQQRAHAARRGRVGDDGARRALPCELVSDVCARLATAATTNGWMLDGFPRTPAQAEMMVSHGLTPDAVIVLDRPTRRGRVPARPAPRARPAPCTKFSPPPDDGDPRGSCGASTTRPCCASAERTSAPSTRSSRCAPPFSRARAAAIPGFHLDEPFGLGAQVFDTTACAIAQSDRCLRTKVIDNARSELETFADACAFLDAVEAEKMALRRAFPVGLGPLIPNSFDAAAAALTGGSAVRAARRPSGSAPSGAAAGSAAPTRPRPRRRRARRRSPTRTTCR